MEEQTRQAVRLLCYDVQRMLPYLRIVDSETEAIHANLIRQVDAVLKLTSVQAQEVK
jgi:hypothetical protein